MRYDGYDLARDVTDEAFGPGTYAEMNAGNPDPGVQGAIKRGSQETPVPMRAVPVGTVEGRLPGMRSEPGWLGEFSRNQATGAIENGTAVEKIASEPDDTHQDGARASVLGSLAVPPDLRATYPCEFVYWVEWTDTPRAAVFIGGHRIRRAP